MRDLSPELLDVVAMLRERAAFWEHFVRGDEDGVHPGTLARLDETRVIVDAIVNGKHIGAHARAKGE